MLTKSEIKKIKKGLKKTYSEKMVTFFSILGDKNRHKIFALLMTHKELCVSDLANILEVSVSSISQHLRLLEMSDLVKGERMGQMMCYCLCDTDPDVRAIVKLIS